MKNGIRRAASLILCLMFVTPFLVLISGQAEAAVTYKASYMPSAYDSNIWYNYPTYQTTPVRCHQAEHFFDGSMKDLYSSAVSVYVETNNFTNPDYPFDDFVAWLIALFGPGYVNYTWGGSFGTPVPANATIYIVQIVAAFPSNSPPLRFYYSINDKVSWNQSGDFPASATSVIWNATAMETWTPAMLNSGDTWVKMRALPAPGIHYYLDYLGFIVYYTMPYGSGTPPEEPASGDWSYNINSGTNILGLLGTFGFIGMFAAPLAAIWLYRRDGGGSKIHLFLTAMIAFIVCLGLFLGGINFGG